MNRLRCSKSVYNWNPVIVSAGAPAPDGPPHWHELPAVEAGLTIGFLSAGACAEAEPFIKTRAKIARRIIAIRTYMFTYE